MADACRARVDLDHVTGADPRGGVAVSEHGGDRVLGGEAAAWEITPPCVVTSAPAIDRTTFHAEHVARVMTTSRGSR
jgi:hypothetical protein